MYIVGSGDGDAEFDEVWAAIGMGIFLLAMCLLIFCCCKSMKTRNENHRVNIRTTRNTVSRQRSPRADSTASNANTAANAIQSRTASQVYNNPSGGDPIPYVSGSMPERNVCMKSTFYFQTVLPDKRNIDPTVLREEAEMSGTVGDDEGVIEKGDPPYKKENKNASSYSRFLMATWRRPTATDECSICLLSYNPGQTICLAKNPLCKHVFHHDCIEEWLKDHSDCPLCRVNLVNRPP